MPFDPDIPAYGSPNSSAEIRANLYALNDRIDTIPAGRPDPRGRASRCAATGSRALPMRPTMS